MVSLCPEKSKIKKIDADPSIFTGLDRVCAARHRNVSRD